MAQVYANRVWVNTATTGTGTLALGTAVSGYLTFAQGGVVDTNNVTYCIVDGSSFELGNGTYTSSGTTLSRDTVYINSSGTTSKISLSGSASVFITRATQNPITFAEITATPTTLSGYGIIDGETRGQIEQIRLGAFT